MPLEHPAANDAAVEVSLRVDAHAFGAGVIGGGLFLILDECGLAALVCAADANVLLESRQLACASVGTPRLGVGDIDRVVGRNRNAARQSELPPFVDYLSVQAVDHDAAVLANADE